MPLRRVLTLPPTKRRIFIKPLIAARWFFLLKGDWAAERANMLRPIRPAGQAPRASRPILESGISL
jgi:hypothetical protein